MTRHINSHRPTPHGDGPLTNGRAGAARQSRLPQQHLQPCLLSGRYCQFSHVVQTGPESARPLPHHQSPCPLPVRHSLTPQSTLSDQSLTGSEDGLAYLSRIYLAVSTQFAASRGGHRRTDAAVFHSRLIMNVSRRSLLALFVVLAVSAQTVQRRAIAEIISAILML